MKRPLCAVYISRTIGDASTLPDNRSGTFHYSQSYANSFGPDPESALSLHTHIEERGGREFGASMTFIGWKRFREPSRLTYFLVNKTGVRRGREKRAELAEDTLLGAITTAINETNRI